MLSGLWPLIRVRCGQHPICDASLWTPRLGVMAGSDIRNAVRLTRAAPSFGVDATATAAGVQTAALKRRLRRLAARGACAEKSAEAAVRGKTAMLRSLAASHRACPPPALALCVSDRSTRAAAAAALVPRVPAWAARPKHAQRSGDDLSDLYSAASDPRQPPLALTHFCDMAHAAYFWKAAAANPACLAPALAKLAASSDDSLKAAAAANPSCPAALVSKLACDESLTVRTSAVSNPVCPPDVLTRAAVAAVGSSLVLVMTAISNPSFPHDGFMALARSGNLQMLERLANAERCPPEALDELIAARVGGSVIYKAARNPNCSPATLRRLAGSNDEELETAVALNPACPPDALKTLAGSYYNVIWHAARHRSCPPRTLAHIVNELHEPDLSAAAAANPSCPEPVLRHLAAQLADNSVADVAGLSQSLAQNPACPPAILQQIASQRLAAVQSLLAANPNCPDGVLKDLAESAHSHAAERAAVHPNIPAATLRRLVKLPGPRFAAQAARNPSVAPSLLIELASHPDPAVRAALTTNRRCGAALLRWMSTDPAGSVRDAVERARRPS